MFESEQIQQYNHPSTNHIRQWVSKTLFVSVKCTRRIGCVASQIISRVPYKSIQTTAKTACSCAVFCFAVCNCRIGKRAPTNSSCSNHCTIIIRYISATPCATIKHHIFTHFWKRVSYNQTCRQSNHPVFRW